MNTTITILRVIHIVSGVIWAGGAFTMTGFVGPTAQILKQDAAKFMQTFNQKFPIGMGIAGTLTVLSGLTMYVIKFGWSLNFNSFENTALTLGALGGITAYLIGIIVLMKNNNRIAEIGKEAAASGGPPSDAQMAEIGALQESNAKAGMWVTILVTIAIIGMSLSEQHNR